MTIYDKFVRLLKDWQYCPVVPEIRELEKTITSSQVFAKSITLGEESRPDKLVFYVTGRNIDRGRGGGYRTKDYEIIVVKSWNHGVQVWAIGDGACQVTQHIRNILMKEVE
jgi:hypothetical protein